MAFLRRTCPHTVAISPGPPPTPQYGRAERASPMRPVGAAAHEPRALTRARRVTATAGQHTGTLDSASRHAVWCRAP